MLTTALSTHDWHSRHLKSKAARKRREHGQRKEGYTCRSPRAHRASQSPYILAHNAGKYPPPHSAAQCSVFFFWQWQCVHTQGTEVDERHRLAKRSGSRELDTHAIEAQLSTQS